MKGCLCTPSTETFTSELAPFRAGCYAQVGPYWEGSVPEVPRPGLSPRGSEKGQCLLVGWAEDEE